MVIIPFLIFLHSSFQLITFKFMITGTYGFLLVVFTHLQFDHASAVHHNTDT